MWEEGGFVLYTDGGTQMEIVQEGGNEEGQELFMRL